ncbi:MAG: hypothetical protein ABEK59_01375 [Halobacteria archaeon]
MKPEKKDISEIDKKEEYYQQWIDWADEHRAGFLGSVLLPRNPSEEAEKLFHKSMTEYGPHGVAYAQEGLHMNGEYFDDYFVDGNDSFEEMKEAFETDIETFISMA